MSRIAIGRVSAAGVDAAEAVVQVNPLTGLPVRPYDSPDGRGVQVTSSLGVLFSDDFGGAAVDAARWDVLDGGLGANPNLGQGVLVQAAIGTGVAGITDSVAGSALTVAMNTTNAAERWYLSRQVFAGAEDVTVILSKSQPITANSIFIGLVEVDPVTGIPLLNPNLAGDFTNRGGVEFGATATTTAYHCEAVADSSPLVASGSTAVAAALTTSQEYLLEFHAEDIIGSNAAVDSTAAKLATPSRVSTQCPNDARVYKLLMRFRNVSAPGSNTNVVIQRVLVVDCHEQRVEVTSGRGDAIGAKALPVNVISLPTLAAVTTVTKIGTVNSGNVVGGHTPHHLVSAATTNATSVQGSISRLYGGCVSNLTASFKFLRIYNKASAPTVGTDVPVMVVPIPPNSTIPVPPNNDIGVSLSLGLAYAITGASPDLDATAVAAGDVIVNLLFS